MPEEQEVETTELQETLDELHEERRERQAEEKQYAWVRYIALTTAFLAVFAAIGALQSGTLVNEAMILQLQSSDKWNEYQAARQKEHLYTLQALSLVDAGAKPPAVRHDTVAHAGNASVKVPDGVAKSKPAGAHKPSAHKTTWIAKPPDERLTEYIGQINHEAEKEKDLSKEAGDLAKESEHAMHVHHRYAHAVAMIQVAIALSAVGALTRIKPVWVLSMLVGTGGIVFFVLGLMNR
jgi:hypothetical protein